jgi:hypothetical protein
MCWDTLLVHGTLYKNLFNGSYNVIFVETFDSSIGDNNNYLLAVVLFYLEAFQSSRVGVPTFVKNNLIGSIKHIS